MRYTILLSLLLISQSFLVFGQSETRVLREFSEISAHESINVVLKTGDENTAKISVDGIDLDEVLTEINAGRLKIHLDGSNYRNIDVDVVVTFAQPLIGVYASSSGSILLKEDLKCNTKFKIDVSSSGQIELMLVDAPSIDLEASSSGDIDVNVKVDKVYARASSSGGINIYGSAFTTDVKTSSSGDFDGYRFSTKKADVSASSGGSIKLTVEEDLTARASSGGSVRYEGNPKYVDSSSSSGGSIKG